MKKKNVFIPLLVFCSCCQTAIEKVPDHIIEPMWKDHPIDDKPSQWEQWWATDAYWMSFLRHQWTCLGNWEDIKNAILLYTCHELLNCSSNVIIKKKRHQKKVDIMEKGPSATELASVTSPCKCLYAFSCVFIVFSVAQQCGIKWWFSSQ